MKGKLLIAILIFAALIIFREMFLLKSQVPAQLPQPPSERVLVLGEIDFYKGVSVAMNDPVSELEKARQMGANIVDLVIIAYPSIDGSWTLGSKPSEKTEEWQNIMARKVKAANDLGMHASITLFVNDENMPKDPQVWLEHAKPFYREIGKFAAENNVYMITVPGEVEVVTGTTCCSLNTGLEITPNNELSAEGFAYWSSKISHELKDELQKHFKGYIVADYIAGNWWFEDGRFVGLPPWNMEGFHAIRSGIQLDDPNFDRDVASISRGRARVLREVANRSGVSKVIFYGALLNAMPRIRGEDFQLTEEERRPLYDIFFSQTHELVNGYFMRRFPPTLNDPAAMEVAKNWYEKL